MSSPPPRRSLASVLQQVEYQSPLHGFSNEQDPRQHFIAAHYSLSGEQTSQIDLTKPARGADSRSMALTSRSYTVKDSTASSNTPSLAYTSSVSDTSSVGTSLASFLPRQQELEDVGEGILVAPNEPQPTVYRCALFFLKCDYVSYDLNEWRTHNLSHFRGLPPPKTVQCTMCDNWSGTYGSSEEAWQVRMDHLTWHLQVGHDIADPRWKPDFHLFHHLWQMRIIDDCQLQQLRTSPHCLTQVPHDPNRRWVSTEGRRRDGRREHSRR